MDSRSEAELKKRIRDGLAQCHEDGAVMKEKKARDLSALSKAVREAAEKSKQRKQEREMDC